ncbi:MAG: efflux RND transporter periplasmic adaptor subunit [Planctomyces sp.]|nr:efflux RND transporter periplasmic adaptor subunit [Planctomyces sp.]
MPTQQTRQSIMASNWLSKLIKLVMFIFVAGTTIYWLRFLPITVTVIEVAEGPIVAEVMGTGTLEAKQKAIISPKISGRIQEVRVDQGDTVQPGDVLFQLDDTELKQQVEMAKVGVAAAKAGLNRYEADQNQAKAVLKQADQNHERVAMLVTSNAASATDMDKAREQMDVALAGVARADAALLEARQQELVAESTLAFHQARLADTVVTAPFAGLIVQRYRDPGAVAVPGSPVLSLISTEVLWVSAWVDETEMSHIAAGQPARVAFRSEDAKTFRGEVARLGRETDRETREFTVDIRVLELPANWAIGQRAEVYIETARRDKAKIIPAIAVSWREATPGVFVQRDGTAQWHPVKLGLSNREQVEILEGVPGGEQILLPSEAAVKNFEGRKVAIQ